MIVSYQRRFDSGFTRGKVLFILSILTIIVLSIDSVYEYRYLILNFISQDDIMLPCRIEAQYNVAKDNKTSVSYSKMKKKKITKIKETLTLQFLNYYSHKLLFEVCIPLLFSSTVYLGSQIIGGNFKRQPADATARFSHWANTINGEKLGTQVYTSHGPTVIMPTWFCHRSVFER